MGIGGLTLSSLRMEISGAWRGGGGGGSKTKASTVDRVWIFSGTAQFKSIANTVVIA